MPGVCVFSLPLTIVLSLLKLAFLMASHTTVVSLKHPACVFFMCGTHILQALQEPVLATWGRCLPPVNVPGVEKLALLPWPGLRV